ncbi:putative periplasmic serine endoprotease DegP-like protein [Nitrospira sp.]|nr:putative periplasmic serine endoprotease DegP-like protein [Nitrospira sp.]
MDHVTTIEAPAPRRVARRTSSPRLPVLVGALLALAMIAFDLPSRVVTHVAYAMERGRITANGEELSEAGQIANTFRMVARVARPGVVSIRSWSEAGLAELQRERAEVEKRIAAAGPNPSREEMRKLAEENRALREREQELRESFEQASGSGVVIDADGSILTNAHVIEGREKVRVRLYNRREFEAQVIGVDSQSDLAVLRIGAHDLHPLRFGNSDEMEVGDWVLAVGAPFGLSHTVSHGIVSAKGRTNIVPGWRMAFQDFIQTDAAINPGNSGGPLLNMRGEVIGINTAIATETGYSAGVGLAIPAKMAMNISEQLRATGVVKRGWLGISMMDVTDRTVDLFGGANYWGVLVDIVYEDSPAYRAGLRCEDMIISVDGADVRTTAAVLAVVGNMLPGDTAHVQVIRNGSLLEIPVKIGERPANIDAYVDTRNAIDAVSLDSLGVQARTMQPELWLFMARRPESRAIAIDAREHAERAGVLVRSVKREGSEAQSLQVGDLITAIDDAPTPTVATLRTRLEGRREARLDVTAPNGETRVVRVKLDE